MTKEAVQEIIKVLNPIYEKLPYKEKMLSAYTLRYGISDDLLHFHYGHIVFADDNTDIDSVKFCLDWVSGKACKSHLPDENIPMNILAVELLVCLSHLKLKDRLKIIYPSLDYNVEWYFSSDEELDAMDINGRDEIDEMHKDGYTTVEKLKEERDAELNEFIKQGLLEGYDIFVVFN